MKVEVTVLVSPFLIVLTVSVDVKQRQSSAAVWKSRWPSWAGSPSLIVLMVSVDVKQQLKKKKKKDSYLWVSSEQALTACEVGHGWRVATSPPSPTQLRPGLGLGYDTRLSWPISHCTDRWWWPRPSRATALTCHEYTDKNPGYTSTLKSRVHCHENATPVPLKPRVHCHENATPEHRSYEHTDMRIPHQCLWNHEYTDMRILHQCLWNHEYTDISILHQSSKVTSTLT